ncbi:class III lanthionine synthetase LanKC [Streptomyces sp. NPDC059009]|uniref:class III lanthionine synthetase LanKC n=1 Tax=Streptomyces sp. NPDC059009 TaxID=3346694 RepID=UPI0036B1CFDC
MDKRYEVYCLADRHFYETPDRLSVPSRTQNTSVTGEFATAERPVPPGWRQRRAGDWLTLVPLDDAGEPRPGPQQGWKVHVSATLGNADAIAAAVWDYCVPRAVPFKFVPSRQLLHLRNSKYAGRDGSGKAVTVYPADEDQLHQILRELGRILEGFEGPYILTDLRWGEGPLYVRYGAFTRRVCADEKGNLVPAVEDGEGRLVPDTRDPVFKVPAWVTLPPFLEPHLAARNTTTVTDLPYRIEKALHFSNGGGVYVGTDTRDGRKVVLKEGRPHAGLAADGADAVTRLERERDALEALSGLGVAPEVRDWFLLGDHRFLVMDFLEGRTLNSFYAERHPLCVGDPDPADVAEYTQWALRMHRAVEEAVTAVHERGVVFNDLHLFNIMVAPDEKTVALLDFEAATTGGEAGRQVVAHPGFVAPADRTGPDVDRYALACLRLALFLPLTTLLSVDRGKAAHLARLVAAEFPDVPKEFLDEAVREIERPGAAPTAPTASPVSWERPPVEPGDWPASRDSMVRAILAAATPDRDDRLFPGDIAQFSEGGGLGIAHGAAGVLLALHQTGAEPYEEGERWLLGHTDPVPQGTPFGLYDGAAGIAHVLAALGHRGRALDLVDVILRENWQRLPSHLYGGLAGLGLVLHGLADTTGEPTLRDHALRAAHILGERLDQAAADPPKRPRAGLLHGATGSALLFLRLYESEGDPALLELAARALHTDLDRCVPQRDGSLAVDEGRRTLPYLGDGSVGIGMVLDDYLAHRPDERFEAARPDILAAARARFCVQPGLFRGRAGLLLHLGRTTTPDVTSGEVAAQVEALGWFTMPYQGQLAFPGDQMMRLSMDLHTGTAGCLLALGATLGDGPHTPHVPFLPPPERPQNRLRTPGPGAAES